jgi:predicted branched-subunit amino acid permease
VVDASWAMASRGGGRFDREFMIGATVPQMVLWIGGTVVGGVVGDVERWELDVIFPAFYLALLVEELRAGGRCGADRCGAGARPGPFHAPGVPVLVAVAVVATVAARTFI